MMIPPCLRSLQAIFTPTFVDFVYARYVVHKTARLGVRATFPICAVGHVANLNTTMPNVHRRTGVSKLNDLFFPFLCYGLTVSTLCLGMRFSPLLVRDTMCTVLMCYAMWGHGGRCAKIVSRVPGQCLYGVQGC